MIAYVLVMLSIAGIEQVLPLPLETPPFENTSGECYCADSMLELISCTANGVTDYESWFDSVEAIGGDWPSRTFHNGGINDAIRGDIPPVGIGSALAVPGGDTFHLYQTINSNDYIIAFYGDPPNRFNVVLYPRILVLLNRNTFKVADVLDFLTYAYDPAQTANEEREFTFQALKWAEADDGVLYVSNAHRTYSEISGGSNGYITALDMNTLEVLWRSDPLVSNSENFLLLDDVIVTGYGFTDEDDFVYLLDRATGEVIESVAVPSAPEYFHIYWNTLYVRCYDTDCVFEIND